MKLAIAILLLCSVAHAQSTYDWSLTNTTATVTGSGTFEVGQWTTAGGPILYPINNLSGMLNGLPLSLTPGYTIANPNGLAGINNGNAFYTQSLPIAPAWPLYFQSGPAQQWKLWQSDFFQPGVTGQVLYNLTGGTSVPVAFAVKPTPPMFTKVLRPDPISGPVDSAPPAVTQPMIAAAIRKQGQMNVGLEVGVPVAFAVTVYLVHRYWPHHREAVPAGRFSWR